MIDLHCHILPGLDDGCQTMDDTMDMAQMAKLHGIRTVVATPHHADGHYENEAFAIRERVDRTNALLRERQSELLLLPGQEIRVNDQLLEELDQNKLITLNDSQYILLEFPHQYVPERIEELFHELRLRSLIPVIAHPERNVGIIQNPRIVGRLKELGALFQLTAGSLLGKHGRTIQKLSFLFCRESMVQFIASDAHNRIRGIDHLAKAYELIEQRYGKPMALYFQDNAHAVVHSMTIQNFEAPKKRRWLFF
ncbi:tyrosine protein phosphatase [Paenibacillus sp. MZ04-78.2]|uniref:tyrosine-protein phosphatase n=1 Tax=Paenibacillus sp. MZ04-78.2 TaxID=2962034 RepID=UPI0020B90233|nr:CpsB/CapC family capsule biosynthesis tyrosine phosphatase [Paenibacillus sp. MZ04-78.2]MCP3773471.1 tyrosine protein phosphatase [Paenibacillus sp. MZ04-78.2]